MLTAMKAGSTAAVRPDCNQVESTVVLLDCTRVESTVVLLGCTKFVDTGRPGCKEFVGNILAAGIHHKAGDACTGH